jgi:hypothetical protein
VTGAQHVRICQGSVKTVQVGSNQNRPL